MARQNFPPPLPALAQRPEGKQPESEKPPEPSATEKTSTFAFGKTSWFRSLSGWFSSTIVHLTILVLLATFTLPSASSKQPQELCVSTDPQPPELQTEENEEKAKLDIKPSEPKDSVLVKDPTPVLIESLSTADDVAGAPTQVEASELGFEKALPSNLLATVGALTGTELGGRGQKSRERLLSEGGGNKASERAVALALNWIAEHQMPDGGWSFRIDLHPKCHGKCRNSGYGYASARTAATGLALLPFLSAGETHLKGRYQKNVERGLKFLISQMNPKNGYLGGTSSTASAMYSHGIASIALCEAYAMTKDHELLLEPAQKCIEYICEAQDPVGGGWRYTFREAGDTSIVGWQLIALKSAQLANLEVPKEVLKKADQFLDFVQSDDGAQYGYMTRSIPSPTRTSIGLLCRMYGGWQKENPALKKGVQLLSKTGPDVGQDGRGVYYNYYATQVMHHWGGKEWRQWNQVMRDHLIKTQAKKGHERGSWFSPCHSHGQSSAGRLYCTCMNVMILEIYYRYMPLYQKKSTDKKRID